MKKIKVLLFSMLAVMCMMANVYGAECAESPTGAHASWVYVDNITMVSQKTCTKHSKCFEVRVRHEFGTKCKYCRTILKYSNDYTTQHTND